MEPATLANRLRHALMTLIAGRRFAWWISDDAYRRIDSLSVAGAGAAICLVKAVKDTPFDSATYDLDGFRITVERIRNRGPEE
jgi:hypothetical protein